MFRPHDVDDAVRSARLVVGLGDPGATWSVLLRLRLSKALDHEFVRLAGAAMVADFPSLGRAPELVTTTIASEPSVLTQFADRPYGDREPLLRVGLADDGHSLLLGCHHGAIDGLGLLGAASRLMGIVVSSEARGRPEGSGAGFAGRAIRRLATTALRPPARLGEGHPDDSAPGDHLGCTGGPPLPVSSAALVVAAATVVRSWNDEQGARSAPLTVAVGMSRRPGRPVPPPDRRTGLMIIRADDLRTVADAQERLASTTPEPAYPARGGHTLAPGMVRRLQARVAATIGVSNLGRVTGDGVERVDFWPVAAGPTGIALGLASTAGSTSLTTRAPRRWFAAADGEALEGAAWRALATAAEPPAQ